MFAPTVSRQYCVWQSRDNKAKALISRSLLKWLDYCGGRGRCLVGREV